MKIIADHILASVDEVIGAWIALQLHEPWVQLPSPDVVDHLPAVITNMVRASLSEPSNLDRHRDKVHAAAEHGRQRRKAGFDDEVIFQEYYGIRNALWTLIRPRYPDTRAAEAMLRMDTAISVALRASLVGFHEESLLQSGTDVNERLETLAGESPLLHWP
jgi:hypothetical protein